MAHKIGNIIFNKVSNGWTIPKILEQRIIETEIAYNSLKDYDKTHKDFDDYTKKIEEKVTEHKISSTC